MGRPTLTAALSEADRNPATNIAHGGDPVKATAQPGSVRNHVPCESLEPDLPWGGQGQDDQHGEQGQGEALVDVPGRQSRRSTGQEEVTHWWEDGKGLQ